MLRILSYLLVFTIAMTGGLSAADAKKKAKPNLKYASIVMDADSGMILSQRYADKTLHPASLTKMMTMLLMFEALDRGDVQKSDRIRMSNHAASMQPSKLGIPAGSSIKVEDALYILATKSANDVAVAMAEHLGGSENKFAAMMTARARTIGMNKTRFRNASGLHDKYQVSTARDMAKMARYILQRYPHYYSYFSTKSYTYKGVSYRNHNRLMQTYKGMDGFKTGYINASGFNLVASAYQDGRRLIGVVFGGRTTKSRNSHMANILDAGFKKAGKVRIASVKTPPVPIQKPIYGLASMTAQPAQIGNIPAVRARPQQVASTASTTGYTSLSALNSETKIISDRKADIDDNISPNYTALSEALQQGTFGEMIGEGDIDPATARRLETGMIAMAVHKGDYKSHIEPAAGHVKAALQTQSQERIATVNPSLPKNLNGKWAVQIGAYTNRSATNDALKTAKSKLPGDIGRAIALTVPLRTTDGMIYRARLGDLNEEQARRACKYLNDCMVIAPINARAAAR